MVGNTSEVWDLLEVAYTERIYKLTSMKKSAKIAFKIDASSDSPLFNPAFEINNWGNGAPKLFMNGKEIPAGDQFKYGI